MNFPPRRLPRLIPIASLLTLVACSQAAGDSTMNDPSSAPLASEIPGLDGMPVEQLGGQSGGETDTSLALFGTDACVCFADAPALARVVQADVSCARLELVSKPAGATSVANIEVGELFGGALQQRCSSAEAPEVGALVAVQFFPGLQTSIGCDAFNQCLSDDCEAPLFRGETSVEDQQRIIADWEQCNSACAQSTLEACSANAEVARFNGLAQVLELTEDQTVMHEVDGQVRTLSLAEISAPECASSFGVTPASGGAASGLAASSGPGASSAAASGLAEDPDGANTGAVPPGLGASDLCPVP